MIPSDLGLKGDVCSAFTHVGLDTDFCTPCGFACVLLTCVQEVYSVSVASILRENLTVFLCIDNSWITMLQGRNSSHK